MEVGIVVGEQFGDDGPVPVRRGDHVEVGRAHVMTVGDREQLTDRPVTGDRVADRLGRPQVVVTVGTGPEPAAKVVVRLRRVDVLVQAVAVGAPHVQHGTVDRRTAGIEYPAVDVGRVPVVGTPGNVGAVGFPWRARPVERPEHAGLKRPVRAARCHGVDHHGQAEDIGKQDVLVPCRVADVTAPLEEVGGGQQLGGRQPDLAGEVVGVPDHGRQDLARPGVPGTGDGGEHLRGDLLTRRRPGRRGGVCIGTVGREIPENPDQDVWFGTMRVIRVHEGVPDHAGRVDDVHRGQRHLCGVHPVERGDVVAVAQLVADDLRRDLVGQPELAGDRVALVEQHGERQRVAVRGERCPVRQLRADRNEAGTERLDLRQPALQRAQLNVAVGAPAASVEGDDQRSPVQQPTGVDGLGRDRGQAEHRHPVADVERPVGDLGVRHCGHRVGPRLPLLRTALLVCSPTLCLELVFQAHRRCPPSLWRWSARTVPPTLTSFGSTSTIHTRNAASGVPVAAAAAADTWVTSARLVAASCPWAMVIWMNGMAALPSIRCGVGGR